MQTGPAPNHDTDGEISLALSDALHQAIGDHGPREEPRESQEQERDSGGQLRRQDIPAYFHEHELAAEGEENQTTAPVDAFAVIQHSDIEIIVRRDTGCMLCVRSFRSEHVLAQIWTADNSPLSHMSDSAC